MLDDWRQHLRAENRAPSTIQSYLIVGHKFARFVKESGLPTQVTALTRAHVEAWAGACQRGAQQADRCPHLGRPGSQCYRSLQQFFRWVADEEGIVSPMSKTRPPAVTEQPVPVLTDGDANGAVYVTQQFYGTADDRNVCVSPDGQVRAHLSIPDNDTVLAVSAADIFSLNLDTGNLTETPLPVTC